MNWFGFAFCSIFFFTALGILQRIIAVSSNNQRAMSVLFNFIAAGMALILFFVTGSYKNFSFPSGYQPWLVLLVASFGYGMFERGRFVASKLIDASLLVTLGNINVLVAFVGSLILYNEKLTLDKTIGSLLIIFSLILVSLGKNKKKFPLKSILIVLGVYSMLGVGWMLDKYGAHFFKAETYNIIIWIAPIFFIYFPQIKFKFIKQEFKTASWRIFLLAGLNVVGYYFQLKALSLTEATKVIPILQTGTILTVIAGVILLNERENMVRKIIAGLIAVAGVYFLFQ